MSTKIYAPTAGNCYGEELREHFEIEYITVLVYEDGISMHMGNDENLINRDGVHAETYTTLSSIDARMLATLLNKAADLMDKKEYPDVEFI